jgi:hypothetical protein
MPVFLGNLYLYCGSYNSQIMLKKRSNTTP